MPHFVQNVLSKFERYPLTFGPTHQNVADAVINGVFERNPAFLNQAAPHADLGGDGRHLTRVVGLDTPDGDERVGIRSYGIRNDVFELAHLVTAKGEARIAVLALGIEFDRAAEMLRMEGMMTFEPAGK